MENGTVIQATLDRSTPREQGRPVPVQSNSVDTVQISSLAETPAVVREEAPVPVPISEPTSNSEKNQKLSEKEIKALAVELEQSLRETQVKFEVSIVGEQTSGLRFVVVEKDTGKVIREFPPEDLLGVKERRLNAQEHLGRLFEKTV